jgi:hypothetical protein
LKIESGKWKGETPAVVESLPVNIKVVFRLYGSIGKIDPAGG